MIAVGGLTPFTTVDYPGQHAAIVFCQGCPWRCPYCHNTHLQDGEASIRPWSEVMRFLQSRADLLDAVVFSGGEPLLQQRLPDAMRQVRGLGYKIGLHTGGSDPERLRAVLPLVDWIGFDVKAPWKDYERITQVRASGTQAWESLLAVLESNVPFQARTTVHPALLDDAALRKIDVQLKEIGMVGENAWIQQTFREQGCTEPSLLNTTARQVPHRLTADCGRNSSGGNTAGKPWQSNFPAGTFGHDFKGSKGGMPFGPAQVSSNDHNSPFRRVNVRE